MSLNGTMAPMYSPIKSLEENSNHDEGIFTVLISVRNLLNSLMMYGSIDNRTCGGKWWHGLILGRMEILLAGAR